MNWKTEAMILLKRVMTPGILAILSGGLVAQPVAEPTTLGQLFQTGGAPANLSSRGVFLRQFDLVDASETARKLQIALVIDGTESMGRDISTAIARLGDFVLGLQSRRPAGSRIELGLVVYRDVNAKSGAAKLGTPAFVSDLSQFQDVLRTVETEPGEPYFEEAVDVGVHTALSQLNWDPRAADLETSRWMLVCGDAPPYPDDKAEYRKFSTQALVDTAKEKGIHVSSVICSAGFLDPAKGDEVLRKTYEDKLPRTREFMKSLSEGTGGRYFDLADIAFVQNLTDAIKKSGQRYKSIDPIAAADIEAARKKNQGKEAELGVPLRFAVLPHAPRSALRNQDDALASQVAVEMRTKLSLAPNVHLRRLDEVQAMLRSTDLAAIKSDEELVRKVADELQVDYVVWGEATEEKDKASLAGRLFRGDGRLVAKTEKTAAGSEPSAVTGLAGSVLERLIFLTGQELSKLEGVDPKEAATFAAIGTRDVSKQLVARLANDVRALRYLTAGIKELEQATSQKMGAPESKQQLLKAKTLFLSALQHEPDNAFANLQLASCYFNLARYEEDGTSSQNELLGEMRRSIQKAHAVREAYPVDLVRTEIEADHALMGQDAPDIAAAVRLYEALATQAGTTSEFSRRAHWALSGMRLGDWGVDAVAPDAVDPVKSREHIIQILAQWPESPEAKFYAPFVNTKGAPEIPLIAAWMSKPPVRSGG